MAFAGAILCCLAFALGAVVGPSSLVNGECADPDICSRVYRGFRLKDGGGGGGGGPTPFCEIEAMGDGFPYTVAANTAAIWLLPRVDGTSS